MMLLLFSYTLNLNEKLEYKAKYGPINIGEMFLKVEGIEIVRGIPCYKLRLFAKGGALGINLYEDFISWVDTQNFRTVKFYKRQIEPGWNYEVTINYYEDYAEYDEIKDGKRDKKTFQIPKNALDPVALIYIVRFLDLKDTILLPYHMDGFSGYAKIFIKRKEKCKWLGFEEDCYVISPILPMDEGKKREVLGDRGGEIIISSSKKIPIKIKVNLVVGSMIGYIVKISP
ncbi:MAG: DUF3108 domain-containing protein [Candidatus Hydrothermia bacterium]|jgi:hypothetical protein